MMITLLAIRWLLALVFWSSGFAKINRRGKTAFAARNFGVPETLAPLVAWVLPVVEVLLAFALAIGVALPIAGIASISLLLSFSGAIAVSLLNGKRFDCGCGIGNQEISGVLIARNLVLAGLVLTVALVPPARLALWPLVSEGTAHVTIENLLPVPAAVVVLGITSRCLQLAHTSLSK